jgi:predicted nucleic-acid-binding protein
MIGFDTNLLLRLFETDEHPGQTAAAQRALREQAPVFINPVVLVEFAWTLRRTFKLRRAGIHARLKKIVESPEFAVAFPQQTRSAIDLFGGGPADFPDYFVAELNLALGCDATLTFDKAAAKNRAFRRLPV